MTLGDRQLAERVASEALADGVRRADALRHPDRGAAWLRGHVLRAISRPRRRGPAPAEAERRAALAPLGVDAATFSALRALDPVDRVTLVAGWIEGLDSRDLEGVLRYRPATLARVLARARTQFLDGYLRAAPAMPPVMRDPTATGPLARRIRAVAEQTIGGSGSLA